ncbi:MAG: peptidylprolyl isomerase [Synergistota bacterium]|nr:peptidylprolyl isomerase [Synergistota bacterium]
MIFSKRGIAVLSVAALFALFAVATSFAADRGPVVTVGGEQVGEQEFIDLTVRQSGAQKAMVPFLLSQMTMEQRMDMVDKITAALLLSQAAQVRGVNLDPDVATEIRWTVANILAQAYISEIAADWDMSVEAQKAFYESHKDMYVAPQQAHTRHILVKTEEEATDVLLEIYARDGDFGQAAAKYSQDPGSASKGGDLGWLSPGDTVPAFDELVFSLEAGEKGGPVKTRFGWHVVEVLDTRPGGQLSFEEAVQEIRQDIQQYYLDRELENLEERFNVEVNEEVLSTLGGFPALKVSE